MLPKKVRLGALEWSIESPTQELDFKERYGETKHLELIIAVDNNRPLQRQQQTLFHEMVHAGTDNILIPEDHLSERQVRAVADTLLTALKLNPEVTAFLLEEGANAE